MREVRVVPNIPIRDHLPVSQVCFREREKEIERERSRARDREIERKGERERYRKSERERQGESFARHFSRSVWYRNSHSRPPARLPVLFDEGGLGIQPHVG